MTQGFTESPSYFSQILKADLDDVKFSAGSTLLHHIDDLRVCCPSQTSSQEDSIHPRKFLALKGHKVSKEKWHFAQTQVQYLEHVISEQGLLDLDRLHDILNCPESKTKLLRFSWAIWLLLKLDPNFLSSGSAPTCFIKNQQI